MLMLIQYNYAGPKVSLGSDHATVGQVYYCKPLRYQMDFAKPDFQFDSTPCICVTSYKKKLKNFAFCVLMVDEL